MTEGADERISRTVCTLFGCGSAAGGQNDAVAVELLSVGRRDGKPVFPSGDAGDFAAADQTDTAALECEAQDIEHHDSLLAVRIDAPHVLRGAVQTDGFKEIQHTAGAHIREQLFQAGGRLGMIMHRQDGFVAQIAASVSGCKDFLADAVESFEHGDLCIRITPRGGQCGGQSGGASADDQDRVFHVSLPWDW